MGTAAVQFDFVALWLEDRARDVRHPLSHYLALFPDHEEQIAAEYLRLSRSDLERTADPSASGATDQPISAADARYERLREIARGGMGRILLVRDRNLHRNLAMKVARGNGRPARDRLVGEAFVTGELDHPGVVPVHELGRDATGRPFFTMRLVEGLDLREIIDNVHRSKAPWTMTRALEVILKVCDTVAYAHSRGVVHRDLKPSNIRVGSFGEVYVLDWGLAKSTLVAERVASDLDSAAGSPVDAAGPEALSAPSPAETAGITQEGDVVGTPCSMPPEQAAGSLKDIGPRSDVYSMGAMLYELLSRRIPYVQPDERITAAQIVARVLAGPPEPIGHFRSDLPPELVAICDKAMARDPGGRYADMREMAADVRAYLENRVVLAHRSHATARMAKWVSRNRWLSFAILGAGVVAVAALVVIGILQSRNQQRLQLIVDSRSPADLIRRFDEIRPDVPSQVPAMDRWLEEARDLEARGPAYAAELESLRRRAAPYDPSAALEAEALKQRAHTLEQASKLLDHYRGEEARIARDGSLSDERLTLREVRMRIAAVLARTEELTSARPQQLTWRFSDASDQFRHDAIASFLPAFSALVEDGAGASLIARMRRRLEVARTVESATTTQVADRWRVAIASIANARECPAYHGLLLRPQLGLIPIRRDPRSGLWEFQHWESGRAPDVGAGESIVPDESFGIILVLVPGGEFEMGAQRGDPTAPNFDPEADPSEWSTRFEKPSTVHVTLAPFFISKYEMTQAQWLRITGENPSECGPFDPGRRAPDLDHPVERVDWDVAMKTTQQIGLTLPTEAQWEYAARAGTATPWWTGESREELRGAVYLADRGLTENDTLPASPIPGWDESDYGDRPHSPVGSFRPNAFGLHDVCGNVSEWCRDAGGTSYNLAAEVRIDTFERFLLDEGLRVRRGGSTGAWVSSWRSSARQFSGPKQFSAETGLRPSREIER
jgi:formylglycine-generating enzyme required for sulfatase activity/serine/threonine protein kinase